MFLQVTFYFLITLMLKFFFCFDSGTNIDLNLPEKCHIESKRRTSVSDDCSTTTTTISGAQFDSEKVTSLLKVRRHFQNEFVHSSWAESRGGFVE